MCDTLCIANSLVYTICDNLLIGWDCAFHFVWILIEEVSRSRHVLNTSFFNLMHLI